MGRNVYLQFITFQNKLHYSQMHGWTGIWSVLWSALEALDIDWIASLQDLIELGAREPEIHILCSESNVSFII